MEIVDVGKHRRKYASYVIEKCIQNQGKGFPFCPEWLERSFMFRKCFRLKKHIFKDRWERDTSEDGEESQESLNKASKCEELLNSLRDMGVTYQIGIEPLSIDGIDSSKLRIYTYQLTIYASVSESFSSYIYAKYGTGRVIYVNDGNVSIEKAKDFQKRVLSLHQNEIERLFEYGLRGDAHIYDTRLPDLSMKYGEGISFLKSVLAHSSSHFVLTKEGFKNLQHSDDDWDYFYFDKVNMKPLQTEEQMLGLMLAICEYSESKIPEDEVWIIYGDEFSYGVKVVSLKYCDESKTRDLFE